eukprot:Hpha_TRINITY_DN33914_c0_g1::TRINITY_DN33914_c0_g1_i1::g.69390::m.69390
MAQQGGEQDDAEVDWRRGEGIAAGMEDEGRYSTGMYNRQSPPPSPSPSPIPSTGLSSTSTRGRTRSGRGGTVSVRRVTSRQFGAPDTAGRYTPTGDALSSVRRPLRRNTSSKGWSGDLAPIGLTPREDVRPSSTTPPGMSSTKKKGRVPRASTPPPPMSPRGKGMLVELLSADEMERTGTGDEGEVSPRRGRSDARGRRQQRSRSAGLLEQTTSARQNVVVDLIRELEVSDSQVGKARGVEHGGSGREVGRGSKVTRKVSLQLPGPRGPASLPDGEDAAPDFGRVYSYESAGTGRRITRKGSIQEAVRKLSCPTLEPQPLCIDWTDKDGRSMTYRKLKARQLEQQAVDEITIDDAEVKEMKGFVAKRKKWFICLGVLMFGVGVAATVIYFFRDAH